MRKTIFKIGLFALLSIGLLSNIAAQSTSGGRSRRTTTYNLTVNANIRASVQILSQTSKDFNPVNGTTSLVTPVPAGTYEIIVSAPNYITENRQVEVSGNRVETFNLLPATARLNVTSNVNGARINVTGVSNVTGAAPWRADLPFGNYSVAVSADGYISQTKAINLTRATNLHFNLEPNTATLNVVIPPEFLNKKDVDARSKIFIYDNGSLLSGTSFKLRPGQHTIQIVSGGLMTQTTINAAAGRTYTLKPQLTLVVE